ncbi:MAG: hypothetical protein EBZ59_00295 [Planctomycetia bacterium]|nr:hypothetical protein [Planctomycetia bacterium]
MNARGDPSVAFRRGLPRNPFVTRFTRPGRIRPLDAVGRPLDLEALQRRLEAHGWTAAIEGPHGSGKTTLLVHLASELRGWGRLAADLRLRSRRDAFAALGAILLAGSGRVVCIDSWERMGPVLGGLARIVARLRGCGLVITSHRGTGLPLLLRCDTTPALLAGILRQLPDHDRWHGEVVTTTDVDEAFATCGGNLRESLYELYDTFESRVRSV